MHNASMNAQKVGLGRGSHQTQQTGLFRRPDSVFQGRQSYPPGTSMAAEKPGHQNDGMFQGRQSYLPGISMAAEKPGRQKAPDSSGQ